MKLVKDAYHSWGAEVVFITSNWAGNKEIMEGCKAAGIPAFVSPHLPRGIAGVQPMAGRTNSLLTLPLWQGTLWDF